MASWRHGTANGVARYPLKLPIKLTFRHDVAVKAAAATVAMAAIEAAAATDSVRLPNTQLASSQGLAAWEVGINFRPATAAIDIRLLCNAFSLVPTVRPTSFVRNTSALDRDGRSFSRQILQFTHDAVSFSASVPTARRPPSRRR